MLYCSLFVKYYFWVVSFYDEIYQNSKRSMLNQLSFRGVTRIFIGNWLDVQTLKTLSSFKLIFMVGTPHNRSTNYRHSVAHNGLHFDKKNRNSKLVFDCFGYSKLPYRNNTILIEFSICITFWQFCYHYWNINHYSLQK